MMFAAYFGLFALIVLASTLEARTTARYARAHEVAPSSPSDHARIAAMYAERAHAFWEESQRQQESDRFLAVYYQQRAAQMQLLEAKHKRLAR